MKAIRQRVRYVNASDGTRLAWAEAGDGPLVVKAANWLTHLEYEWESPVWKHWIQFFSANFRFVRYDERGCGMSEWHGGPLSIEQWADDLDRVIDAAQPDGPVMLLGISQGAATCVRYAIAVSGTRRADDFLRRLRARRAAAEHAGSRGAAPGDDRAGAGCVGKGQSDLPPGLHVALHSGRNARAAPMVQRSLPEDDHGRGLLTPAHGARDVDIVAAARRRAGARRWCFTRETTRSSRLRRGG